MTCCRCGDVALYRSGQRGFCKLHRADAVTLEQANAARCAVYRHHRLGTNRRRFSTKGGYGRFIGNTRG